ncbi:MAG: hypothetical protein HKL80_09920 [Acidimicrobiales bacterium]|nr:hypothetical protein [Acidimicrobiales bacterium]
MTDEPTLKVLNLIEPFNQETKFFNLPGELEITLENDYVNRESEPRRRKLIWQE